jgi:alkanesulfonate monooxygenase
MKIAVLCNTGPYAWLQADAVEGDMDLGLYQHIARTAERGKLDLLFVADTVGIRTLRREGPQDEGVGNAVHHDPMLMLAALSQSTNHVGLVGTISTTYAHPYAIARSVGSLDHLTQGRGGWNVVTSGSDPEAHNFGLERQLDSDTRYRRANEAIDVVCSLWDSFDDNAFLRDRGGCRYFDSAKMHRLAHRGEFFDVAGPLNMRRPPQGRPLISQAGTSAAGQAMAARTADIMYANYNLLEGGHAARSFPAAGRRYRDGISALMAEYGRAPNELLILPGIFTVLGGTELEAQRKFADFQAFMDDEAGLKFLERLWGIDLHGHPIDDPIPDIPELARYAGGSGQERRMTIRQAFHWLSSALGHLSVIGTPEQAADTMQSWYDEGGADGFNLFSHSLPGSLDDFVGEVVPILQKRGLMQSEYAQGTLRDKLALRPPENRFR